MPTRNYTPKWVGHRGWPERYPENSLEGLKTALEAGADAIEVDIQFTQDRQPVICHDANLERVSNQANELASLTWEQLQTISVHEPQRFNEKFKPTSIPHLKSLQSIAEDFPNRTIFIEIKEEVFLKTEREMALDILASQLNNLNCPWFLISYDLDVLQLAQQMFNWKTGWVLTYYNSKSLKLIEQTPTDFLICNIKKIPEGESALWPGPWDWFIYDITHQKNYQRCEKLNVPWLETWDIAWQSRC